jgi:hypothetical protein
MHQSSACFATVPGGGEIVLRLLPDLWRIAVVSHR